MKIHRNYHKSEQKPNKYWEKMDRASGIHKIILGCLTFVSKTQKGCSEEKLFEEEMVECFPNLAKINLTDERCLLNPKASPPKSTLKHISFFKLMTKKKIWNRTKEKWCIT